MKLWMGNMKLANKLGAFSEDNKKSYKKQIANIVSNRLTEEQAGYMQNYLDSLRIRRKRMF